MNTFQSLEEFLNELKQLGLEAEIQDTPVGCRAADKEYVNPAQAFYQRTERKEKMKAESLTSISQL